MKKKTIILFKLFTIVLIMVHIVSLFMSVSGHHDLEFFTNETIIYRLKEDEDPYQLALEHHLDFIHLKPSLVATFKTTSKTDINSLIDLGFSIDHQSYVFAPPWQRTADKFINEQYALNLMGTKEAWNITVGVSSLKVAIIDTGIDIFHEEFSGRISALSYNSVSEKVGLDHVKDDFGHGTMVAGVIAATKDNGKGIAGIAQNIELLVIKANNPNLGTFSDTSIIEGIYYAVDNGAKIINLSLGGSSRNQVMIEALKYAESNEVLVIAASGNDGTLGVKYPAAYEQTLAVSAIDQTQTITNFSNYGEQIDLSAPGSQIITTANNNGYVTSSGTSFAAPQVSGVAALIYSHFGNISLDEVKTRLFLTSIDLGSIGKDDYYGYGMVHTHNALTYEFIQITFETYLGSKLDARIVRKDAVFNINEIPTLEDHVFEGFYLDPLFTIPFTNNQTILNQDQILYAKFTSLYHQVTLMDQEIIVDQIIVPHGSELVLNPMLKEGYDFIGWSISKDEFILFTSSIVITNLILYAHFKEIIYYQVNYVVLDETILSLSIRENETLDPPIVNQEGYTFIGWYLENTFETPYVNQTITKDTTLFARFDKKQFKITLNTMGGQLLDDIIVYYLETPELPTPIKDQLFFVDWYIDDLFQLRYDGSPIINDMTLYARYEIEVIKITYILFDEIDDIKFIAVGEKAFEISYDIEGYQFIGWYYDQLFLEPYLKEALHQDTILYAKLTLMLFQVIFYDSDLITILHEYQVSYGTNIELPLGPDKPNTQTLTFTFKSWSSSSKFVESNMDIFPMYDVVFDWTQLHLNPGKDTVYESESWIDQGIYNPDTSLNIVVIDYLYSQLKGKYQIIYQVYYQEKLLIEFIRMIRIIEDPIDIDIKLNPSVDTIFVNNQYIDQGIFGTFDDLIIETNLDITIPGTYQITYWVLISNDMYQLVRYVHVLSREDTEVHHAIPFLKKEDYHEIH